MSLKRSTIDSFFNPLHQAKRTKSTVISDEQDDAEYSIHSTYPLPVPYLPPDISDGLGFVPASEGRTINDKPDLDLVYYSPYIPTHVQRRLFDFLREKLFFYRVQYKIKRGSIETQINTPRYTTVFGVDATSYFTTDTATKDAEIYETSTSKPIPADKYKCRPRPLPQCLQKLRDITESATGETFNFCLVNYYASGSDSISYHSDDERFLGPDPAIASLSLGAKRDFLLRHKPPASKGASKEESTEMAIERTAIEIAAANPLKFPLASGDMIFMRGRTQSHWLHSIPKRKGASGEGGRINITFRKALVKAGTENYYTYNVGTGPAFKWDNDTREMKIYKRAT